jgi:hypothetical protein
MFPGFYHERRIPCTRKISARATLSLNAFCVRSGFVPNYDERYRTGERISTSFVESTVNQVISKRFCKKQQMQWTKSAAHLLLEMRVKTLNHESGTVFRRWYPHFPIQQDEARAA